MCDRILGFLVYFLNFMVFFTVHKVFLFLLRFHDRMKQEENKGKKQMRGRGREREGGREGGNMEGMEGCR